MFQVQVLPARVTGSEGRYALDGIDITGFEVAGATIDVTDAECRFTFESFPIETAAGRGRLLKTNLIRRRTGWSWLDFRGRGGANDAGEIVNPPSVLVSLEYGNTHFYVITVHLDRLRLQHYPKAATEPRLRPTCRAREIILGDEIGRIRMRGREHPVYETALVLAA